MMRSTVDLPHPDGPTSAVRLPEGGDMIHAVDGDERLAVESELLAQLDQLDPRRRSHVADRPFSWSGKTSA